MELPHVLQVDIIMQVIRAYSMTGKMEDSARGVTAAVQVVG